MVNKMFKLSELTIPREEVLRYLGHKSSQKIDDNINNLIDECIEETKKIINPKFVFAEYTKTLIDDGVKIDGTNLILEGNDIREHLKSAKKVVLMAVTLGNNIEQKTRLYERINLTKAVILDSCATTAVEEICDKIEEYVKEEALKEDLGITFRYSPGYGDLPLDVQKNFVNTLRADKTIGLTVSENNLLMPRKSVTAIIGLIPKDMEVKKRGCEVCKNYENCSFRKEGKSCGN